MAERQDRIARNEVLFRDLNERLKEITESLTAGDDEGILEIFCECGSVDCMERIRVAVESYERVRATPERFLVAPDHDVPEVEDVVDRIDACWVVEKHEGQARIARETHPRGR
jgi:hypothetical protein